MRSTVPILLAAVVLLAGVTLTAFGQNAANEDSQRESRPWWDDYPLILRNADVDTALKMNALALLCGVRDDPYWGIYAQRLRSPGDQIERLHAAGLKAICWFEGFGTTMLYIAHLEKNADGSWIKRADDPETTRIFHNHWGWQDCDGSGEVRWVGMPNYFDDHDFARPYTRTHPRYGTGNVTYPDGRVATGYAGSETDPRTHRIYDAACSKSILGDVSWEYHFNDKVNSTDPETGQLRGPVANLLEVGGRYAGAASGGRDSACPIWIDYLRASITHALDAGLDGVWVDNFSAWDSFGSQPISRAFGEWSVATFRSYLKRCFSAKELADMGIMDVDSFDVRIYLCEKGREWVGNDANVTTRFLQEPFDGTNVYTSDPARLETRWIDDPVWRAYLIHKRQMGTQALETYYRTIKEIASAHGKPDFLVAGNDIPFISLGWVRGHLDMVSTELSWDWGLASGPRGIMPPPRGSYVPVYKLAREHAKSRFVNVWMYIPEEQKGKPNIADVLHYQGLANQTLPAATPGNDRDAGTTESNTAFFDFVQSIKGVLGDREPVEEIGLYFSSSSQLLSFTPGGFLAHNNQEHVFAHWGWGTALTWLQYQYCAVPEWKLTQDGLKGLKVLIIPNSIVFDPDDIGVLKKWVESGGKLIVTGKSGMRAGEAGNFERRKSSALASLTGVRYSGSTQEQVMRQLGAGKVYYLAQPIGLDFFKADKERIKMLHIFREAVKTVAGDEPQFVFSDVEKIPTSVGLVAYVDEKTDRLFVDVSNTDIDIHTDRLSPSPTLRFRIRLPAFLHGEKLSARAFSPRGDVRANLIPQDDDTVIIELPSISLYVCLVIDKV